MWGATLSNSLTVGTGIFQSTHPVWGATRSWSRPWASWRFQSTHPVWGATEGKQSYSSNEQFQSTHPVWGATCLSGERQRRDDISIHAPRVGCDGAIEALGWPLDNFNPRTPCGVRRIFCRKIWPARRFQSTHPVWGATKKDRPVC